MFEGTSWWFRIFYFLTAMVPAYILFAFQFVDNYISDFDANLNENDTNTSNVYLQLIIIVVLIFILGLLIGKFLKRKIKGAADVDFTKDFKLDNIQHYSKNGEVISFLLGVVFPSVFTFSNNKMISIII